MRSAIDGAAVNAGSSWITRRGFLASMATLVAAPRVFGQGGSRPTIRTLRINSCGIAVTDVARSVEWYQSLFGMPIQAMQGETAILRLGEGPRYLAISPRGDEPPGFTSLGLAVENYDPERLAATLNAAGAQAEVRRRGPEQGGAPEGTPEVFFTDPLGGPVRARSTNRSSACRCRHNRVRTSFSWPSDPGPTSSRWAARDRSRARAATSASPWKGSTRAA